MPRKAGMLSVEEHSRDSAGMTYVYPVVSRRAGGVSIGINLNPNNACNWQCVYCQVPNLVRGGPPPIDLILLHGELRSFLAEIQSGKFMHDRVPVDARSLKDVAFSGNGEPTMALEFEEAVNLVIRTLDESGLLGKLKLRLITNGSQIDKAVVRRGLAALAANNGETWFKLDGVTPSQFADFNGVRITTKAHLRRLRVCAEICPTWIQSCFFMRDGRLPEDSQLDAYVNAIEQLADKLAGVHLYGIARQSFQPSSERLARLPATWFEPLAERLQALGLTVTISP